MKLYAEIKDWKYWGHLVTDAIIILLVLDYFLHTDMFNLMNVIKSTGLLGLADIISHQIWRIH